MRAGVHIGVDGFSDGVEHRHLPLLAALAGDPHGLAANVGRAESQRLGNAQSAAVEQQQNGRVALLRPAGAGLGSTQPLRLLRRYRPRHLALGARRGKRGDAGAVDPARRTQPPEEAAQHRNLACGRAVRQAAAAALRQIGAEIIYLQRSEVRPAGRSPQMLHEEAEEAPHRCVIGAQRMCRPALAGSEVHHEIGAQRGHGPV